MESLALWLRPYLVPFFKGFELVYFQDDGDRTVDVRLKKYPGLVGPEEITIDVQFGRGNAKEIRHAIAHGDQETLDMFGRHIAGRFHKRINEYRDGNIISELNWSMVVEGEVKA
jgi:hypothetical protein